MTEPWTVSDYYAAVRAAELKPTNVHTVYVDADGHTWTVDDPGPMTPAQRRETFALLEFRRGRGPAPFSGL